MTTKRNPACGVSWLVNKKSRNCGIFLILGRMTGLLRHLVKLCYAQAAYSRPPFYCGSNGFFAGSHPILSQNKKNRLAATFFILGRMTGFEPATFGTTNQRSNQLSYIRHTQFFLVELIRLELTTPCMPCKCSTN